MVTSEERKIITDSYRKYIYAIEWLDKNENVLDEALIDVISGNASFDATSNNRRSFSLILRNLDGKYIPSSSSNLWIDHKIRLKCGYESLNGTQLLYNQGIYVLGNPNILSTPTRKEVSLECLDKWTLLDGTIAGKLKNKYIINIGTRIDEAVKAVIIDSGEIKYIIDECNITVPYTMTYEIGKTYADIFKDLCEIVSFETNYDINGYFRFKKALDEDDYNSIPSSWDYTTVNGNGSANLYLQSNRELQWNDIKNSIGVYGMTDSNLGIQYTAFSSDLTGSELSIDKIGERFEPIEDDKIYTTDLCKQRSDYELLKRIKANEKVTLDIVSNFSHKLEDIISLTDNSNGSSGNYLIQGISYNLGYNTKMTLTLWKCRYIS